MSYFSLDTIIITMDTVKSLGSIDGSSLVFEYTTFLTNSLNLPM